MVGVEDAIHLSGPMLLRGNIIRCSPKMHYVLHVLFSEKILWKEGKILLVADDVIFPGILFIGDVLTENGMVARGRLSTDISICLACGHAKPHHLKV